MTDRPIIFSAAMVRALLDGRKTMTRRLAWREDGKPSPWLKLHDAFNYRPIEGHPDYRAGRDGVIHRVVSPFRYRPLQPSARTKYPSVSLSTGGVVQTKNVHRLICEAWYGPPPSPDHEARHLDSDRMNSAVDNLDWVLPEGNWTDRNGLGRGVREEHHAAKLTPAQILEIRASTESQRALADRYGVAQSTILEAKTGRTWAEPGNPASILMPRPAGPKLWVRESFHTTEGGPRPIIGYMADVRCDPRGLGWKPSIHMPRWASRITLVVTATKIERLQEISEEDAIAEGVVWSDEWRGWVIPGVEHPNPDFPVLSRGTAREAYAALWDTLHGSGEWLRGPEVVALAFAVHRANIDRMEEAA